MPDVNARSLGIAEILRGYSLELNPGGRKVVDAVPGRLDPGTEIFLPWIPGANPMDLVAPAAQLRSKGFFPVPHIGARHIQSRTQLEELVARLASDAQVDRVLIVAGDRKKGIGPYDSTLDVLRTGILQKAGIIRVAIAGFPEGNPNISDEALIEVLMEKIKFAQRDGLDTSIVTQFCFASEPIVAWLQKIRALGVDVPVRVGLAGPVGLMTLTRYAIRCGVGNSLRVLTEKPLFAKLLVEKGPEPIMCGIMSLLGQGNSENLWHGISGFHFFVFGSFDKTVDWIHGRAAQCVQKI